MGDRLEKRSQWLGPDYYEGEKNGEKTTVTPRTEWFVTKYYEGDVNGKQRTATPGTDWFGKEYIEIEGDDTPVEQKYESTPGTSGSTGTLIDRIIYFFYKTLFGAMGFFAAIPLIVAGIALLCIPVVIWGILFDNAQGHTSEVTFTMISVIVGAIAAYFAGNCMVKSGRRTFSWPILCVGPLVSGLLLGGFSALIPEAFQGNVFASSIENFLGGGLIGLLLGIVPGIVGCVIGMLMAPKKR